jgi:hypothetical protein
MKYIDWNKEKNIKLKNERGISFEDIISALENGGLLDMDNSYNQKKYPHQQMFVVDIDDYVFLVPYVEDEDKIFLKTIIPSRKATRKYLFNK